MFWIAQDSAYVSGSECARVSGIPGFWICLCFWICQDSEYARVTQGWEYASIIPEYAWICLIMSGYIGTCVNMNKSDWMTIVLYFPISPFVKQSHFYLNKWLLIWTSVGDYSL